MAALDFSTGLVLVAVSLFSALSVLFLAGLLGRHRNPAARQQRLVDTSARTLFEFRQKRLIDATPAALVFAGAPMNNDDVWQAVCKKIAPLNSDFGAGFANLSRDCPEFSVDLSAHQQALAWFDHGSVFLEIIDRPVALKMARPPTSSDPDKVDLAALVDASPILAWSQDFEGRISWANRRYLDLLRQKEPENYTGTPPFQPLFSTPEGGADSGRKSLYIPDKSRLLWFETISQNAGPENSGDGATLHFAIPADPVVKAEEALRNFVQTLTKTFAHLPIGLAIFDRDRKLALFNPALADLTTLDPAWLTDRPSLYAFLDRLRENRHLPEPKDYKSWRYEIAELEKAAEHGTYEENWPLPSGQVYRVTGRPHPEGAVAFLFEDITAEILLRRQFRSELALCQSVLDSDQDAIAVFSAGEELVMSNDAYATLWGIAPDEMLARVTLDEARLHWMSSVQKTVKSGASPAMPNTSGGRRLMRSETHILTSGVFLDIRISPLSQGATLYRFSASPPRGKAVPNKKLDARLVEYQ